MSRWGDRQRTSKHSRACTMILDISKVCSADGSPATATACKAFSTAFTSKLCQGRGCAQGSQRCILQRQALLVQHSIHCCLYPELLLEAEQCAQQTCSGKTVMVQLVLWLVQTALITLPPSAGAPLEVKMIEVWRPAAQASLLCTVHTWQPTRAKWCSADKWH